MVEKVLQKEKGGEAPALTYYDRSMQEQHERNLRAQRGKKVIKGKEIPWELNRQGIIRWYATHNDLALTNNNWEIFCHEIRHHSGKHRHQGGRNIFVIRGRGYTIIDGRRFDWKEGDLILLPFKKGGVEHQHFNLDVQPSRWVAFRHHPINNSVGDEKKQIEEFSLWKDKKQI